MRVVICGGGVIGACTAYFLARRGIDVIVVERAGGAAGRGNPAFPGALTGMASIFQRPVTIAAMVAVFSIIVMAIVNHTNLVVDHRPPITPPGTTFHSVNDAGAQMTPTRPPSPLDPPRVGQLPSEQGTPD